MSELNALYYPYATPRSIEKLKKSLLIFDHIYFIIPSYENDYHSLGIERGISPSQFDKFIELHYPLHEPIKKGLFKIIKPADNVNEFGELITKALEDDKNDPQFVSESKNQAEWFLYAEKIPNGLYEVFERDNLEIYKKNRNFRLPFLIGESIMISHAVYSLISKELNGELISPITEDKIHENFFKHRLNRGRKIMEIETSKSYPEISKEKIDIALLPKIPNTIEEIMDFRKEHNSSLVDMRKCMKELIKLQKTTPKPNDYAIQFTNIQKTIKEIYNQIGQQKIPNEVIIKRKETITGVLGQDITGVLGLTVEPHISSAAMTHERTNFSTKIINHSNDFSNYSPFFELSVV
ncbi:MAG TPA: hypothetical protein VFK40_12570 [Nitrososphaeraceae archaeon]|nr:hypothetical protein [Nitrososphaeraceae archaeon]